MPNDYSGPLQAAIDAAQEAGRMLREESHRPGGPRGAGYHAEIDEIVERMIREKLLTAFRWDYLGEETGHQDNGGRPHRWLVDPNDGTSSFLKGWRGAAVSIAALRDGLPILGVVYAYNYPDDRGDLIAWAEGCGPVRRNGQTLDVDLSRLTVDQEANPPDVVVLTQGAQRSPEANSICAAPFRFITLPSLAYRLALVAVGEGVAGVSLSGPHSWDFGGGDALLRASGGRLKGLAHRPRGKLENEDEVRYAADGSSSIYHLFGGAPAAIDLLRTRDWQSVFGTTRSRSQPPYRPIHPTPGRAITDADRLARAQGCLLGQLAGDSLGGLVEFRSSESIRKGHPSGVRRLMDGGTWENLAGQPTDDSEMALMLARTLVRQKRFDAGAALEASVHWWDDPATFDRGSTIGRALSAASRGRTPAERRELVRRGANPQSQSNGSLMRISPLGIFAAGRPEDAAKMAREDSGLTHPHPVCQDACAVFVAAIAAAIEGGDREACYAAAQAEAERSHAQASIREALDRARSERPADFQTNMGWVLIALQNAFYQLLHAPNLEEGVVDTVMRGGDTDTNAAIAGALLGAVHGRQAVPVA